MPVALTTPTPPPVRPRRVWPPVVLAVGCAVAYAVCFVLPYYVNDLDRFPLQEVAGGYHDPADQWPYDGTAVGLYGFGFGTLTTLWFGPVVAASAVAWSLASLWRDRSNHALWQRTVLVLAIAVAVGTLVAMQTPFGVALTQWWLD